jgi:hypothetical protein
MEPKKECNNNHSNLECLVYVTTWKTVEIADEARKLKINLLAIQEPRWPGQGRIDKQDYSVFYSGPNSRSGQCGTGFIIDAQA